jgi:hypothetical protein
VAVLITVYGYWQKFELNCEGQILGVKINGEWNDNGIMWSIFTDGFSFIGFC